MNWCWKRACVQTLSLSFDELLMKLLHSLASVAHDSPGVTADGNKKTYGETKECFVLQPELCASVC